MQVTVLGGGNVALATAVILSDRGHAVKLWSALPGEIAPLAGGIEAAGALCNVYRVDLTSEIDEALAARDAVVLSLPAFVHAGVMDLLAEHLPDGVPVVIHPATGLTTLYLDRELRARGRRSLLIDLSTSLSACRRQGEKRIYLYSIKDEIDLATLPADRLEDGLSLARTLFGDRFAPVSTILGIALNNHNPIYHLPPFLANLTRIERGEEWVVWDMMTPGVVELIEKADAERMAVATAYDTQAIPLSGYLERSYAIKTDTLVEGYRALARKLNGPLGPQVLDHRFLTEDNPYALALFALLGRQAGVAMPCTEALLHIGNILIEHLGKPTAGLLEALDLARRKPSEILALCRSGHV